MTLRKLIEAVEAGALSAGNYPIETLPQYTEVMAAYRGSLDAAKALHDALLPGWGVASMCQLWDVSPGGDFIGIGNDWSVELHQHKGDVQGLQVSATSSNPARAWLLAILRALDPRGEHG